MRENDSSSMFAGGIIVVVIVVMFFLKAIQKIFIQLERTFEAFGKMSESFFMMAWRALLALGLIAAAIACVFAAGYFSYKYYLMVKRGTELKRHLDHQLEEIVAQVNAKLREMRESNHERIQIMESKLREALDKPAMVPLVNVAESLIAPATTSTEVVDTTKSEEPSIREASLSAQNVNNPF